VKTIIGLIKRLFGPEPKSPTPPGLKWPVTSAKERYECGWRHSHNSKPGPRYVGRMTGQTPVELRAEDESRGMPWFSEDSQ
jgi:hypothetical protein